MIRNRFLCFILVLLAIQVFPTALKAEPGHDCIAAYSAVITYVSRDIPNFFDLQNLDIFSGQTIKQGLQTCGTVIGSAMIASVVTDIQTALLTGIGVEVILRGKNIAEFCKIFYVDKYPKVRNIYYSVVFPDRLGRHELDEFHTAVITKFHQSLTTWQNSYVDLRRAKSRPDSNELTFRIDAILKHRNEHSCWPVIGWGLPSWSWLVSHIVHVLLSKYDPGTASFWPSQVNEPRLLEEAPPPYE